MVALHGRASELEKGGARAQFAEPLSEGWRESSARASGTLTRSRPALASNCKAKPKTPEPWFLRLQGPFAFMLSGERS
jgi:hypothetical protein